jgi:hypothetical protein
MTEDDDNPYNKEVEKGRRMRKCFIGEEKRKNEDERM